MATLKRESKTLLSIVGLVVIGIVGAVLMGSSRPVSTKPPGTVYMYDDFGFTVSSAEERATLGAKTSRYLIKVKVENHAKRVDYQFDPVVVAPTTETGANMTLSSRQMLSDTTVGPGLSAEYDLEFEGPADTKTLNVRFRFGGALGSVMDDLMYGPRQIRVPVR